MSVTLTAPEERIRPAYPQPKRWTREERSRLSHHGIFETFRYELIEGQFIHKMSKNIPHMQAFAEDEAVSCLAAPAAFKRVAELL